jgi:hypothetical protein
MPVAASSIICHDIFLTASGASLGPASSAIPQAMHAVPAHLQQQNREQNLVVVESVFEKR